MVNQNKMFSFKTKRQAKNVFPRDVERIVVLMARNRTLTSDVAINYKYMFT